MHNKPVTAESRLLVVQQREPVVCTAIVPPLRCRSAATCVEPPLHMAAVRPRAISRPGIAPWYCMRFHAAVAGSVSRVPARARESLAAEEHAFGRQLGCC